MKRRIKNQSRVTRERIKTLVILLLASCFLVLLSCNPLKKLPEGKYFLNRNIIHTDSMKLTPEETASVLKQKPNRKILGIFRFHMGVYYMGSAGDTTVEGHHFISRFWKKIKRGMREVGEAPVLVDSFLTAKSRIQLLTLLQGKGYFEAKVSDSIIPLNRTKGEAFKVPLQGFELAKKANVVYYIKEGQPYKIRDVFYSSQDPDVANILTIVKPNSLLKPGQRYDVDMLTKERDRVTSAIRDRGMYFFTRNYITYPNDSSLNSHQVDVYMYVNRRFENVAGSSGTNQEPENHHRYRMNKIYVITNYEAGAGAGGNPARTMDTTFFNGYYFITPHSVLHSAVDSDYVKREALLRVLFIKPGNEYYKKDFDYTYNRLSDLGIFRFINYEFKEVPRDSAQKNYLLDIYIQLSPLEKYGYKAELVGTNNGGNLGAAGSISFLNKNLARSAGTLEFKLAGGLEKLPNFADNSTRYVYLFNTYNVGPEVTLGFKRFLLPGFIEKKTSRFFNPKTVITTGFDYQTRPDYTRLITKFSFGYQWHISARQRLALYPFEVSAVNVNLTNNFNQELQQTNDPNLIYSYKNHLITSGRLNWQLTNQTQNKEKDFFYLRSNFESAGFLLNFYSVNTPGIATDSATHKLELFNNIYSQYIKPDVDFTYHQVLNLNNSMVYHFAAGIGFTYDNSEGLLLPFDKAFFAGGANDIRAWLARTLGPGSYSNPLYIENGGDIKLESNVEYRSAIFKVLETAVFVDAGNIWIRKDPSGTLSSEVFKTATFMNEVAIGAGVGLRFNFTFFIIRTDFAVKLRDPSLIGNQWYYASKHDFIDGIVPNLAIGYPF